MLTDDQREAVKNAGVEVATLRLAAMSRLEPQTVVHGYPWNEGTLMSALRPSNDPRTDHCQLADWTAPAVPANDNEQDWLTSLSQSYPTIASLEENYAYSRRELGGVAVAISCAAVGWGYVLAESFSSLERLLN